MSSMFLLFLTLLVSKLFVLVWFSLGTCQVPGGYLLIFHFVSYYTLHFYFYFPVLFVSFVSVGLIVLVFVLFWVVLCRFVTFCVRIVPFLYASCVSFISLVLFSPPFRFVYFLFIAP